MDGRAFYTRRGSAAQRAEDQPVLELSFELDVVALQLSRESCLSHARVVFESCLVSCRVRTAQRDIMVRV